MTVDGRSAPDADGPTAPRVVGIVQARMTSTRLPGKVLLRVGGRTVLERVVTAAIASGAVESVVVATSTDVEDDAVAAESARLGVDCHRGDRDDVLGRFLSTLDDHPADGVARFTADCPLLDPAIVATTARVFAVAGVDYVGTGLNRTLPRGLDAEFVTAEALRIAGEKATAHHRDHVTSYVYSYPEAFSVLGVSFPPDRSRHRLTLDTADDLRLIRAVVDRFGDDPVPLAEVVAWLDARPDVAGLNAHVTQKPLEDG